MTGPTKADLQAELARVRAHTTALEQRAEQAESWLGASEAPAEALVRELRESREQQTATGEVLDLETVLTTIVARAVELSGLDGGSIFEYDEGREEFELRASLNTDEALVRAQRETRPRKGEGVVGRTAVTLEPAQVPDIAAAGAFDSRLRETLLRAGVRAVLAVPLLREGRLLGSLAVIRNRPGEFAADVVQLLTTFATQSALAIQNARLFRELEDKGRQIEVANRHKSEFLANMSRELRTPLNAIIGYSEMLEEDAADLDGGRLVPDLEKINAAGKHLLELIDAVLDLSRRALERDGVAVIEADNGRVALERAREAPPGLVLLDLLMPEMDGFEFVLEFRRHAEWRHIPVVVLTAKDLSAEDRRRLNGQVERIVQKGGSLATRSWPRCAI